MELENLEDLEDLFETQPYDLSVLVDSLKPSVQTFNARIQGPPSWLAQLGYGAPRSGPPIKTLGTAPARLPTQPPPASDVAKPRHHRKRLYNQVTPRSRLSTQQSLPKQRSVPPQSIVFRQTEEEVEDDSTIHNNSKGGGSRKSNEEQSCNRSLMYMGPPPDEGVFTANGRKVARTTWSDEETNCIIEAIQEDPQIYVRGGWVGIKNTYKEQLRNRTSVMIKDKVKTLFRQGQKVIVEAHRLKLKLQGAD